MLFNAKSGWDQQHVSLNHLLDRNDAIGDWQRKVKLFRGLFVYAIGSERLT